MLKKLILVFLLLSEKRKFSYFIPHFSRFVGGELNICYNAIDRHVENGRGDQIAIIHDSPVTNTKEFITYKEVLEQVSPLGLFFKQAKCPDEQNHRGVCPSTTAINVMLQQR